MAKLAETRSLVARFMAQLWHSQDPWIRDRQPRATLLAALLFGVVACGGSAKGDARGASGQGGGGQPAIPAQAGAASGATGGTTSSAGAEPAESAGAAAAPGEPCVVDGVVHEVGVEYACDCNTCWCETDGHVWSTLAECAPSGCTYAGQSYPAGVTFPSRDGCNQCTCGEEGSANCTAEFCACEPTAEWYRRYVFTDAGPCLGAKFTCPPNTLVFANPCGCGCEEATPCGKTVACDACTDELAQCPFATVDN